VKTAVVDIGTNSTRLLIAEISEGRVTGELVRETTVTRLGQGVDANGSLHPDAIARVYATLDRYRSQIERHAVDRALAVMTSAVRDAANGAEFARDIERRYGVEPHVLAGGDEAQLTYLGATSEHDPGDSTRTLVVDIGGGSTELVIGAGRQARFHVSTQAGVVRQTERHLHSDPPADAELDALAGDVRATLERAIPAAERRETSRAIAVAGTATSLAAIAQELDPYDPERVQGYVLGRPEIEAILDRLRALSLERRREVTGLHPDRAWTIVAGTVILIATIELFGLAQVEVSEHDILRGAALGL
jgi:exopolyphosphatase/guanosine-5'-triphosphate,3'-diphosphate pyrophosphatase